MINKEIIKIESLPVIGLNNSAIFLNLCISFSFKPDPNKDFIFFPSACLIIFDSKVDNIAIMQ